MVDPIIEEARELRARVRDEAMRRVNAELGAGVIHYRGEPPALQLHVDRDSHMADALSYVWNRRRSDVGIRGLRYDQVIIDEAADMPEWRREFLGEWLEPDEEE